MSYFPTFLNLKNKKILIIGGGNIAYNKLEKLLDFTDNITLIAEEFSDEIEKIVKEQNLPKITRSYQKNDIDGFDVVITAVDDMELQKKIFEESRGKNILVNSVDLIDYCDFIFPAYIKKSDLIISISTSGQSPAIAKYLKRYIAKLLPKDLESFLQSMKECRKSLVKGKERMKILDKKAKDYFDKL